jgi:hypothetical protein
VRQFAVIWEPDGPGAWKDALALGELEGHNNSTATGINNAGHIVGRSNVFFEHSHAVMWIANSEGSYDIVDLAPDGVEPGSGTGARFVTEPASDGTVQVVGSQNIAGQTRNMVWTVDVAGRTVVSTREVAPESYSAVVDIDAVGNVLRSNESVWTLAGEVHELPLSGKECGGGARAFDSSGNVFGTAQFSTKKTTCRYNSKDVIDLPVVWMKTVN